MKGMCQELLKVRHGQHLTESEPLDPPKPVDPGRLSHQSTKSTLPAHIVIIIVGIITTVDAENYTSRFMKM